jgi:hypothetical protein
MSVGGLLYCDDYYWGFNEKHYNNYKKTDTNFVFDSPKLGIDSFVNVYANKLRPVLGLTNISSCFIKVAE